MSAPLVWLITGASSGLGRQVALEALNRGDKVIATARPTSVAKLADLKDQGADVLELDVTAPLEVLHEVAKKAAAIHGRIDALVNTAGYILIGPMEETTPQETLEQFNANVFGALNVTRAVLPYMREKKTGTIIFAGSICGLESTPFAGIYAATKWALRGVSQSLHDEISPLGLRSLCVDFGYFRTAILQSERLVTRESTLADYQDRLQRHQPGDPVKGAKVVVDIVKGEGVATGKAFPRSLVLGTDCYNAAKKEVEGMKERLEEWKEVSLSTDFAS
ncbi:unnamed protein product [Cyclocybe aegerita]|uniref:Ketoreductase domain-containing protein n=1 Tax=Cyclocybe aegerita TaxID=1973307 RepID=A0A8S0WAK7_CYCAE|nr:unnamed protein product [Cyclocybe aegerita]